LDFSIPTYEDYIHFLNYDYRLSYLKIICKEYKLKLSGNKSDLVERIFNFLKLSNYIIKIQRTYKGRIVRTLFKLLGPGLKNRKICKNDNDFLTFEEVKDIPIGQFISIVNKNDNSVWGFNIISLYNLFLKSNSNEIKNPYTREKLDIKYYNDIKIIIRLFKLLSIKNQINLENDDNNFSSKKKIELSILSLFQKINELGNYSDSKWLIDLNRSQLVLFIRELFDIWNFRSQINEDTKKSICPPLGNPFKTTNLNIITTMSFFSLQKFSICIIDEMISKGINNDFKSLGAYYVLAAITLVNMDAANALPWLYQSVSLS